MSIEHRWTARRPAGLPVSISCQPLGRRRGRLLNISNGGALVQMHQPLPLNAPVELLLPVRLDAAARSYRLPAIVARRDAAGVGLMFERVEPETWTALLALLAAAESPTIERLVEPAVASVAARA
jgi:PilZ domain